MLLNRQVSTGAEHGTTGGSSGSHGGSKSIRPIALICDPCAFGAFPEFSVHPATDVNFRYGDDGPATAMEITCEIPKIRADMLPSDGLPESEARAGARQVDDGTSSGIITVRFGR